MTFSSHPHLTQDYLRQQRRRLSRDAERWRAYTNNADDKNGKHRPRNSDPTRWPWWLLAHLPTGTRPSRESGVATVRSPAVDNHASVPAWRKTRRLLPAPASIFTRFVRR
jgi:hypothetical protein